MTKSYMDLNHYSRSDLYIAPCLCRLFFLGCAFRISMERMLGTLFLRRCQPINFFQYGLGAGGVICPPLLVKLLHVLSKTVLREGHCKIFRHHLFEESKGSPKFAKIIKQLSRRLWIPAWETVQVEPRLCEFVVSHELHLPPVPALNMHENGFSCCCNRDQLIAHSVQSLPSHSSFSLFLKCKSAGMLQPDYEQGTNDSRNRPYRLNPSGAFSAIKTRHQKARFPYVVVHFLPPVPQVWSSCE